MVLILHNPPTLNNLDLIILLKPLVFWTILVHDLTVFTLLSGCTGLIQCLNTSSAQQSKVILPVSDLVSDYYVLG